MGTSESVEAQPVFKCCTHRLKLHKKWLTKAVAMNMSAIGNCRSSRPHTVDLSWQPADRDSAGYKQLLTG